MKSKDKQYYLKAELRKLIKSWELIPECEFDELNKHLLRILQEEHDDEKLRGVLESELIANYGLYRHEFDVEYLLSAVKAWWKMKKE